MLHISVFLERKPFDLQPSACHSKRIDQLEWGFIQTEGWPLFGYSGVTACCCCCCGPRAKLQISEAFNTHSGNCWMPHSVQFSSRSPFSPDWLYYINLCSIFILFFFVRLHQLIPLLRCGRSERKEFSVSYPVWDVGEQHVTLRHCLGKLLPLNTPWLSSISCMLMTNACIGSWYRKALILGHWKVTLIWRPELTFTIPSIATTSVSESGKWTFTE